MKGVILIFKNLAEKSQSLIKKTEGVYKKLYNYKRRIRIGAFAALSIFSIFFSFAATDVCLAYNVDMGGHIIATVKDKAQFENAVCMVEEKTAVSLEKSVDDVKYVATIVRYDVIDNDAAVADAIINSTDDIVKAQSLYIDGMEYTRVSDLDVEKYLEEYKKGFLLEGIENNVYYSEEIAVKEDYFAADSVDDKALFEQIVKDNLHVVNVCCVSENYTIPFNTVTNKTSKQLVGYSKVETAGVAGVGVKKISNTYINGELVSSEIIEDTVVTAPVNKVVTVGTGRRTASAAEKSYAQSSGFIFPLPNGSWKVSAYWGDGRGHKGLDLAANYGVSIFAVKGGTVTYSGWKSGYGYFVEIDHGDGLKTRYGHASKLCVSVGETVSQGSVIALVGSTGNSTGNHLHFEVVKNGANYNPGPYVGLS